MPSVERFLAGQPEVEGIGEFLKGLTLFVAPGLPLADTALALLGGLLAAILDALPQLLLFLLLLRGGKRLVVAGHQAPVGRPVGVSDIPGADLHAGNLALAIEFAPLV